MLQEHQDHLETSLSTKDQMIEVVMETITEEVMIDQVDLIEIEVLNQEVEEVMIEVMIDDEMIDSVTDLLIEQEKVDKNKVYISFFI